MVYWHILVKMTDMVDKEHFELIKKKYGHYASWAIWADEGETPKSNVGDLNIFDLEKNKDFGLVGSWAKQIDQKSNYLKKIQLKLKPEDLYYLLHFQNCLIHSSVMFRKNIVLEMGGYNENFHYAQDFELWQRCSKKTKIYQLNKFLILLRKTANSMYFKFIREMEKDAFKLIRKNLESILDLRLNSHMVRIFQSAKITRNEDLKKT